MISILIAALAVLAIASSEVSRAAPRNLARIAPPPVDTLPTRRPATRTEIGDSTVLAKGIQCRPGFTAFALKQDWPWSVRAGGLCIMPLGDGPWPWPPGRTSGIVVMPRTPFTTHESSATAWVVVSGILRTELEDARVLVGRTPYPASKYLAVEGPYP